MALTQVGNVETGGAASSGSFSVNAPGGLQNNDVLIVIGASNEGAWDTLPAGFTQFQISTDGSTTNNFRAYGWYKVCGGSEPGSYSFGSTTAAAAGAPMVATVSAWRGVNVSSVIANSSIVSEGTSAEPANPATSFTQSVNGRLFHTRCSRSTTAIPTFNTATTDWTEIADVGFYSGGTVRYGIGLFVSDFDTASGSRTEPAVTCETTETDNVHILFCVTAGDPSDSEAGTGTESELVDVTAPDSDSATGTETEDVSIPNSNSDSGTGAETEGVVTTTITLISDNFNRDNETPLNISSSGNLWTSAGAGVLGVVNNQCKKVA